MNQEILFTTQKDTYAFQIEKKITELEDKPIYTLETESKIKRVAKVIFQVLLFPWGAYELIHRLGGQAVFISSLMTKGEKQARSLFSFLNKIEGFASEEEKKDSTSLIKMRRKFCQNICKNKNFQIFYNKLNTLEHHFTTTSDKNRHESKISIDGEVFTIEIQLNPFIKNKRFTVFTWGNGERVKDTYEESNFLMNKFQSHAILLNAPGSGQQDGLPCRKTAQKLYAAVLKFLEDKENGLGAEEVIGYGHSMGGAWQAEGVKFFQEKLKTDSKVKYLWIKNLTFGTLEKEISFLVNKKLAFLAKMFNWNYQTTKLSLENKDHEIIIQKSENDDITNADDIVNDGVIFKEASLAYELLTQNPKIKNKTFVTSPCKGVVFGSERPFGHNVPYVSISENGGKMFTKIDQTIQKQFS